MLNFWVGGGGVGEDGGEGGDASGGVNGDDSCGMYCLVKLTVEVKLMDYILTLHTVVGPPALHRSTH